MATTPNTPGTWRVSNTTVKIKIGGAKTAMRIFNTGPSNVIVKDAKKLTALIAAGNSCDIEGTELSVTGANSSGTYERL